MENIGTLIVYLGFLGGFMMVLGLSTCAVEKLYETNPNVKSFIDKRYKDFD